MSGYYMGKWRSEAWHLDGGANDEGWHDKYCYSCGSVTEHGLTDGCVPCGDRAIRNWKAQRGKQTATVGEYTITKYPNGKKYCNCKGFKFRKTCKHINIAKF